MKLYIALLLITLVLGNQPQGIFPIEIEQQLKQSNLGRVFLRLVTLKSKAQQFDFSQLFTALDELENSIKQRKEDEMNDFKADGVQYFTDVDFYSGQITQFQNEIATHEIDITDFTESRDALQVALQGKNQESKEVKESRDKLSQQMAKEEAIFKDQQSQYNNAITAIDQALELVGSLRDGAFIQNADKQVVMLETALKELTHRRTMYSPLISALMQMLSPSFNDQEASSKVLKLLQNLRDSITKSKQELENSYSVERSVDEQNLSDYNLRLSTLNDIIIPTIQNEIQTKDTQIQTKSGLLKDAQNNLLASQNNLNVTNDRWIQRQSENSKLIDEYATQLALMPLVNNVLEGAGIRRR